jgi:hypothetical protein
MRSNAVATSKNLCIPITQIDAPVIQSAQGFRHNASDPTAHHVEF